MTALSQAPAYDDVSADVSADVRADAQADAQADAPMPLMLTADVQDHLMTASNDLDRLQRLLADTCELLMQHFHKTFGALGGSDAGPDHMVDALSLLRARQTLAQAVTALQFQDMASQLIAHTHQRLRGCADQLANAAFGPDADGEAAVTPIPLRPNPVTQDEMDAGSVDLF